MYILGSSRNISFYIFAVLFNIIYMLLEYNLLFNIEGGWQAVVAGGGGGRRRRRRAGVGGLYGI